MDWYSIKFLESTKNLRALVKKNMGREMNAAAASGIAACLTHGRLFFEAAERAPLEIRPLQIFYGIVSLSKALAAVRSCKSTDALVSAHGVSDISNKGSLLQNLTLQVGNKGTFQEFNDAICGLDSFNYYGDECEQIRVFKSSSGACELNDEKMTLKDILSRCPFIASSYQKTFDEQPKNLTFTDFVESNEFQIQIDETQLFYDRAQLVELVARLRNTYPFLNNWMLKSAQRAWNNSRLMFVNCDPRGIAEFDENVLVERSGVLSSVTVQPYLDFKTLLPVLSGGVMNKYPTYIVPLNDRAVSEYSLIYLGNFLLSSLVRYRPEIWGNAISSRFSQSGGSDDHCMALIESFLDQTAKTFPEYIIRCMETHNP